MANITFKNQKSRWVMACEKAYTYISTSLSEKTYVKDKNGYYVDASVVTLHSPELDNKFFSRNIWIKIKYYRSCSL